MLQPLLSASDATSMAGQTVPISKSLPCSGMRGYRFLNTTAFYLYAYDDFQNLLEILPPTSEVTGTLREGSTAVTIQYVPAQSGYSGSFSGNTGAWQVAVELYPFGADSAFKSL